ncbi:metallophosphoesterase family protein [Flavihumibacter petaseus]|uniref:Putative phosphatase n=1 Tax=Flavihumibacter petaseus NBRC 106054 TaxID=1220578 RepID=A0A0E9MV99_9BACT|nr:metallophosphoesterase family protein [Flavihumibacter petaseus]GAO41055.1 putative phosphatase [Flavihumibacter petaseus NBRC 106054]
MKTYVIGDIHGALKALEELIDRISPAAEDRLIFLGDLVDGWPDSAEVVAYCIALQARQPCIFIKGNHDSWCEGWLQGAHTGDDWLSHGGDASIRSYAKVREKDRKNHLYFLNHMMPYFVDEENRLYIHAGYTSRNGPSKETYVSNFYWDRSLWEMAACLDKNIPVDSPYYPKRLTHFREIFVGHTPTLNYGITVPMNGGNVWNVDTGGAFQGRLSALEATTKEVIQSSPVQSLYPGIQGRLK